MNPLVSVLQAQKSLLQNTICSKSGVCAYWIPHIVSVIYIMLPQHVNKQKYYVGSRQNPLLRIAKTCINLKPDGSDRIWVQLYESWLYFEISFWRQEVLVSMISKHGNVVKTSFFLAKKNTTHIRAQEITLFCRKPYGGHMNVNKYTNCIFWFCTSHGFILNFPNFILMV